MFKELLEFELDPPELPADDIWAAIFGTGILLRHIGCHLCHVLAILRPRCPGGRRRAAGRRRLASLRHLLHMSWIHMACAARSVRGHTRPGGCNSRRLRWRNRRRRSWSATRSTTDEACGHDQRERILPYLEAVADHYEHLESKKGTT